MKQWILEKEGQLKLFSYFFILILLSANISKADKIKVRIDENGNRIYENYKEIPQQQTQAHQYQKITPLPITQPTYPIPSQQIPIAQKNTTAKTHPAQLTNNFIQQITKLFATAVLYLFMLIFIPWLFISTCKQLVIKNKKMSDYKKKTKFFYKKNSTLSSEKIFSDTKPLSEINIKSEEKLPYIKKDSLLTQSENEFHQVIIPILKKYNVFISTNVRLANIIKLPEYEKRKNIAHWNKIKSKEIDFVICSSETSTILFAIELDDLSHLKSDRAERDKFINKIFKDTGTQLLRIPVENSYDTTYLTDTFKKLIPANLTSMP